jgi:hypothetical protein
MSSLWILCAAGALTQSHGDLIRQLGDDDFSVRELAEEKLNQMGSAAERPLRRALGESKDPEVRHRIQRILEKIESDAAFARLYTPPKPRDLHISGTIEDLGKALGIPFQGLLDRRIELNLKHALPFEAIEAACLQHEDLSYVVNQDAIVFASLRRPKAAPSRSAEAFRFQLSQGARAGKNALVLTGEALPGVKLIGKPAFDLECVEADDGSLLTLLQRAHGLEIGSQAECNGIRCVDCGSNRTDPRYVFVYRGLEHVKRLKRVRGTATVYFSGRPQQVAVEMGAGEVRSGPFAIAADTPSGVSLCATNEGSSHVGVRIRPLDLGPACFLNLAWDLVGDSIVAVDNSGKEHACRVSGRMLAQGWGKSFATVRPGEIGFWGVLLPPGTTWKDVASLRVELATLLSRTYEFEFNDVELGRPDGK